MQRFFMRSRLSTKKAAELAAGSVISVRWQTLHALCQFWKQGGSRRILPQREVGILPQF